MTGEPRLTVAARKIGEWTAERDRLVREARASGRSLRAIAADARLSHPAVVKILARSPKD